MAATSWVVLHAKSITVGLPGGRKGGPHAGLQEVGRSGEAAVLEQARANLWNQNMTGVDSSSSLSWTPGPSPAPRPRLTQAHRDKSRWRLAAIAVLGIALAGCATVREPVSGQALRSVPAEVLNPDVTQATIQQTICIPGYTASVRPSSSFTNGVKLKLLREQALPVSAASDFELDHLVPLALGGHPRALQNLRLQSWTGDRGAKAKDVAERRLQKRVCAGQMGLDEARRLMFFGEWSGADKLDCSRTN